MEKGTIAEVTRLGFMIQAAVGVIGKDLLITLTSGDTPRIGTVITFSRDTEMQATHFPSHDGRFHKDDVLAERIAMIIKTVAPGSCTTTFGIHVDHISNAQINVSFPMSEELGYEILDWLEKINFHIKEPVYCKDGERSL